MSLVVWLPLDGDLHNQGASGAVFSKATNVWGAGKIGAQALLTSTGTASVMVSELQNKQEFSIAYWVKVDSSLTYTAWQDIWAVDYINATGTYPIRDEHTNTAGNHQFIMAKETNTGSNTNPYLGLVMGSAPDKWQHVVLVKGLTQTSTYVNGVPKQTMNNTAFETTAGKLSGNIRIGAATCGAYLNDFRVYDHCLSVAEIKEISQGLVLHYKLDDSLQNANWLTSNTTFSITRSSDNTFADSGYNTSLISNSETVYRVECDAKGTASDMFFDVYFRNSSGAAYAVTPKTAITTVWQHYSLTINGSPSTMTIFRTRCYGGTTGDIIYIKNLRLVSNSTPVNGNIKDNSGYNHNAISNGSQPITIDSDTPKYSCSTKFISGSRIAMPVASSTCLPTDAITVSIWYKSSDGTARFLSCTEGGGWNFEINSSKASFPFYIKGKGYGRVLATQNFYSDNAWHMITASYDGVSTAKIYLDGQLNNTSTITSGWENIPLAYNASTPLTLGAEAQTIASPIAGTYVGNLSDLRIYCTALSDDAVTELYHTGAKVDNKGGIHTYELNEEIGIEENAKFINSSATSMTYDAATDTYTIVSPVGTSSWGYGVRLADTPALMVPYGATYRWTAEIWTPVALNVNTDYNNTAGSADVNWAGNDNDATGTRLTASNAIPANAWTRIYRGASNTHTSNTNHLSIRDYSSLGLVTNGQSGPVTWKIRHLQWYLVDTTFKPQVKKTGIINAEHFTEVEQNLNKPAQFNKQMFSVNGNEFIEL